MFLPWSNSECNGRSRITLFPMRRRDQRAQHPEEKSKSFSALSVGHPPVSTAALKLTLFFRSRLADDSDTLRHLQCDLSISRLLPVAIPICENYHDGPVPDA